jgi:glyoxylase-like metal-dependent hydrolase (beta-lactamase superfamily II)/8-oxo-dGTP pyrophosphatase MutT (NUDIX family)
LPGAEPVPVADDAGEAVVVPRPAATVVLLRPGPDGPEVLLTRRPSTMAFGPGLHVFPGGALDAADAADAGRNPFLVAALRELVEEVGVRLPGPEALVPLSRWVTPPPSERRYDTQFFVAMLPDGAAVVADPREVADHRWLTPRGALAEMAAGSIELWPPTATTLRQLALARDLGDVRRHLAPVAPWSPPVVEPLSPALARVAFGGAGAIPGQAVDGYLVGRSRLVVIDPGDPSDEAAESLLAYAAGRGARLEAILLTAPVPDHAAGAETLAHRLGIPILASATTDRALSTEIVEIEDADRIGYADVEIRVHAAPGTHPDHLAFEVPAADTLLVGDLEGPGPSRAIPEPVDERALARSRERMETVGGRRLAAHR